MQTLGKGLIKDTLLNGALVLFAVVWVAAAAVQELGAPGAPGAGRDTSFVSAGVPPRSGVSTTAPAATGTWPVQRG